MKSGIEAIIFDLGNTLLYFDGDWPEVLDRAELALIYRLQGDGLTIDTGEFQAEFHAKLIEYYQERDTEFIEYSTLYVLRSLLEKIGYSQVSDRILRQALADFYEVTQYHWTIEDDTLATLNTLKRMDYRMGMISNAGDDTDVQDLVDKAGIRSYFESIITSAAEGIRKPNPRIFQILLDHWNIPASRTVMVGDTLGADILGARNAGIFSVWITRRADTPANNAHRDTIHADASIIHLAELPDLLKQIEP